MSLYPTALPSPYCSLKRFNPYCPWVLQFVCSANSRYFIWDHAQAELGGGSSGPAGCVSCYSGRQRREHRIQDGPGDLVSATHLSHCHQISWIILGNHLSLSDCCWKYQCWYQWHKWSFCLVSNTCGKKRCYYFCLFQWDIILTESYCRIWDIFELRTHFQFSWEYVWLTKIIRSWDKSSLEKTTENFFAQPHTQRTISCEIGASFHGAFKSFKDGETKTSLFWCLAVLMVISYCLLKSVYQGCYSACFLQTSQSTHCSSHLKMVDRSLRL